MLRRSKQRLSHYHLTTFDMGYVVPIGCIEMLPGDTFRHSITSLLRVAPLAKPVMHPVYVSIDVFFCPNRILWNEGIGDPDNFEDFITQNDPTAALPTITLTGSNEGVVDRLGVLPTSGLVINALPVRAYNLIYNEFFRDEQLVSAVSIDQTTLLQGAWNKDYYTTCRPNAQQGSGAEQVTFPITGIGIEDGSTWNETNVDVRETGASATTQYASSKSSANTTGGQMQFEQDPNNAGFPNIRGTFDINELRAGYAVQRYRERRNRFGDRFSDMIRAMGVNIGDGRLNRPERVAGGRSVISFSEVLATAEGTTVEVGELFGHGISALSTRPSKYFAPEYGYCIALMTIRPKPIYVDAIHRTFVRSTYDDFWSPEFQSLGNQAVTETEVYAPGGNSTSVFGWQSRHNDYRYQPSFVSGEFRSTENDWHYARDFASAPTLNSDFILCDPTDRVYLDTGIPEIYAMCQHNLMARRLVSQNAMNP